MHEIFLIVIQGVGEKGEGRTDFCHKKSKGGGRFLFLLIKQIRGLEYIEKPSEDFSIITHFLI